MDGSIGGRLLPASPLISGQDPGPNSPLRRLWTKIKASVSKSPAKIKEFIRHPDQDFDVESNDSREGDLSKPDNKGNTRGHYCFLEPHRDSADILDDLEILNKQGYRFSNVKNLNGFTEADLLWHTTCNVYLPEIIGLFIEMGGEFSDRHTERFKRSTAPYLITAHQMVCQSLAARDSLFVQSVLDVFAEANPGVPITAEHEQAIREAASARLEGGMGLVVQIIASDLQEKLGLPAIQRRPASSL